MRPSRPRRWRQWTLKTRLAVAVAGLTALALLVANGASLVLLKSYLVDRVDQQLASQGKSADFDKSRLAALKQTAARNRDSATSLLTRHYGGGTLIYYVTGHSGPSELFPAGGSSPGPRLPAYAELAHRAGGGPFTVPGEDGSADWRAVVRPLADSADGGFLIVATSLQPVQATYDRMLITDAVVLAVVLALLSVGAALLVRVGLRPLTRMETTAGHIAAGDFTCRVEDTDPHTEPGRLGQVMNAMLGRVESEITARAASEVRLRRFLADASHELRTPLTSIRGFAELYRRGGADADDAMRRIEDEAARTGVLVEDLLLLARLDEQREPERSPVDQLQLCADLVRALHARSPHRTVRLAALDGADGLIEPVTVLGDPLRLRQAIGNLLANADRHTPPGARITVRLGTARAGAQGSAAAAVGTGPAPGTQVAVVEVADTGPGVPPEHAPHVFERLYRADAARSSGGSGLGLSIAAAVVQAHRGRIELAAHRPGAGATFRIILPKPSAAAGGGPGGAAPAGNAVPRVL